MPVIALTTIPEEGLPEKEGVIKVTWPCETKVLVERIEATLAGPEAAILVPQRHLLALLPRPGRGERALGGVMCLFVAPKTRCA